MINYDKPFRWYHKLLGYCFLSGLIFFGVERMSESKKNLANFLYDTGPFTRPSIVVPFFLLLPFIFFCAELFVTRNRKDKFRFSHWYKEEVDYDVEVLIKGLQLENVNGEWISEQDNHFTVLVTRGSKSGSSTILVRRNSLGIGRDCKRKFEQIKDSLKKSVI